jgi:hypothetical protein
MAQLMRICRAATLVTVGMVGPFGLYAQAQEFSADLVITTTIGQPGLPPGKLYVSNGKVRIESPDALGGFFLVDPGAKAAYYVRPAQRMFMDSRRSSRLTEIFVPLDPDNPCPEWRAMMKVAGVTDDDGGWLCDPLGRGTVGGRSTMRYQIGFPQRHLSFGWIDQKLKFPIRMQAQDGTVELENIQEGGRPASLFEIPAGYRKFDPQQLIDRIKQSDVWVEPPR